MMVRVLHGVDAHIREVPVGTTSIAGVLSMGARNDRNWYVTDGTLHYVRMRVV
jgi:hypothetical protein